MVSVKPFRGLLCLVFLVLLCHLRTTNGHLRKKCNIQRFFPKVNKTKPRDCSDVQRCGAIRSGVYKIYPEGGSGEGIRVFCDMNTAGGGWTVFQRRMDGSVNFFRGWHLYKTGFGNVFREHWLGNDNLHMLTMQDRYELYILMESWDKKTVYARYKDFFIEGEDGKYKLHVSGYHGTAADSLAWHNNARFSTKDQDNDAHGGHCAIIYKGAWWFTKCHHSDLNGLYHHNGAHKSNADGVNWYHYKGWHYSLKHVRMMVRPLRFKY